MQVRQTTGKVALFCELTSQVSNLVTKSKHHHFIAYLQEIQLRGTETPSQTWDIKYISLDKKIY
jgi:hypothetical protein